MVAAKERYSNEKRITMSTSQQASSNLEFTALCAFEKNDIAAILLRYDELINTYKNKLAEIGAAINVNSTELEKTSALTQLNLWAKNTDKLDPFIGNYETKDAKKRLQTLLNRKVHFKSVSSCIPTNLTDSDNPTFVKTDSTSRKVAVPKRQDGDDTKQYKLGGNTPTFGSSDTDEIHDWIFTIEQSFISYGIPEDMQIYVITPFLRAGALKSLKRYIMREGTEATWSEFRDQLIKEYEPHDIQSRLKMQLVRLKQTETFEKYVSQFKSIVNRIDNISEEDTVLYFTEGLQPKTRLEVLNKRCPNLEEAIIYASNAESCLSRPVEVNLANSKGSYNRENSFRE